jgi:hypothetical protein
MLHEIVCLFVTYYAFDSWVSYASFQMFVHEIWENIICERIFEFDRAHVIARRVSYTY